MFCLVIRVNNDRQSMILKQTSPTLYCMDNLDILIDSLTLKPYSTGRPFTALQDFGQSAMLQQCSRNFKVVVKACMKRHDRQLTALVLTLPKNYVAESPWIHSATKALY